jgi:hypothetical protein
MSKLRWERTKGHLFPLNESFTPDMVRDSFAKITDFSEPQYPTSPQDAFGQIMANLEAAKSGASSPSPSSSSSSAPVSPSSSSSGGSTIRVKPLGGGSAAAPSSPAAAGGKPAKGGKPKAKKDGDASVDAALVMAHKFHDTTFAYTEKDVILYALGVGMFTSLCHLNAFAFTTFISYVLFMMTGAGASEPTSDAELKYTYEGHSDFGVVPTFGVVAAGNILLG